MDDKRPTVSAAFESNGLLRFSTGLVMDMNQPIEWPEPFPQIARVMLARDLCNLIEQMRMDGFDFLPIDQVTQEEREAGEKFFTNALTRFAIDEHQNGNSSLQNDWHFGAIVIGAIQFADKVEAEAHRVIARTATPIEVMPAEVMSLLDDFIALDREKYEMEAKSLSSLAAQSEQASRTIQ